MNLSIGDSVKVNQGVIDPDFDFDISGWQGRIEEIFDGEGLVLIRWESMTLAQMPLELVIQCENENFDWEIMTLYGADIHVAKERDSTDDTHNAAMRIKHQIMDDPGSMMMMIRVRKDPGL